MSAADITRRLEVAASRILAYISEPGSERYCAQATQILLDLWPTLDAWARAERRLIPDQAENLVETRALLDAWDKARARLLDLLSVPEEVGP